ncbi:MAG: anthranilate phosphoribosyltransferase [Moraxellaceae bacterium]|nr:MAG: anthranilate phosphoribosyltransferase [Moraxellaceae bacterium]
MDIKQALQKVIESQDLTEAEMGEVMQQIMTGQATDSQIGGFLIGLRMKGETVDEITGAASVMRKLAKPVSINRDHLVDTCGTGGDGANTFNISTTCAFVVAAAGGFVAKHGNRSVSSTSGSADVLEAAGVKLDITPEQVANCVEAIGVGFMFAPMHHSAMKHAIGPRKEMAVRTIFNILGPLTNPAGADSQVMGVYSKQWVRPVADVLLRLGSRHVMVVHAADGLDEISIAAETFVAEVKNGEVSEYTITPEQFGLSRSPLSSIAADGVQDSLRILNTVLANEAGPAADIVALNAGAAIYVAGIADNLAQGIEMAQDAIGSGVAKDKLTELVNMSEVFRLEAEA